MSWSVEKEDMDKFLQEHLLPTVSEYVSKSMCEPVAEGYVEDCLKAAHHMNPIEGEGFNYAEQFTGELTVIVSDSLSEALTDSRLLSGSGHRDRVSSYLDSMVVVEHLIVMCEGEPLDMYAISYPEVYVECYKREWERLGGGDRLGFTPFLLYVESPVLNYAIYSLHAKTDRHYQTHQVIRKIHDFITSKTGLRFYGGTEDDEQTRVVFPFVGSSDSNASVHSKLRIYNDVYSPSYVSYNSSGDYARASDTEKKNNRLGIVAAPCIHHTIGFAGECPREFFLAGNYDTCEAVDISTQVEIKGDVTWLTKNEDASGKVGMVQTFNAMNFETEILVADILDLNIDKEKIHKCYYTRERVHNPHTVEKWEPLDNSPFKLRDVPDVRVMNLCATPMSDGSTPQVFFVQSESTQWYRFNYSEFFGVSMTRKQIQDLEVCGLTSEEVFDATLEIYEFGHTFIRGGRSGNDVYFVESGAAAVVKKLAEQAGRAVRITHGDSYLAMNNDMRVVWELLTADNGTLFR